MKYSEATKAIKNLSKKYSVLNDGDFYDILYNGSTVLDILKSGQYDFGMSIDESYFDSLPFSHKLWMIASELAMTPLNEREEHKWNVIVGNDDSKIGSIVAWEKSLLGHGYVLSLDGLDHLTYDGAVFTDKEFNDLIKHIKTLPDGEYQAKVAEHGKKEVQ